MRNYFLQKEVHDIIQLHVNGTAILSTVPIDIVPSDLTYFMMRYDRLSDQTAKELEATKPIENESMLKVVDMDGYTGDTKSILDELHTMYIMGLVVLRGSVYYMLPKAIDLFYKPGEGFFDKMTGSAKDRDAAANRVLDHMTEYVLPGRWWRAYYAKKGLAPSVQPVVALQREMEEIEAVLGLPMHV